MSSAPKRSTLEWSVIASLLLVIAGIPIFQAVQESLHEGRVRILDLFTHAPTKRNLHSWDQRSRDNSVIGKWIRSRILQIQYDAFGDVGPKAVAGREGWLFYRPDVEYLANPGFQDERFFLGSFDTTIDGVRANLRNPMVAIRDVHRQLSERGIVLVVVPVPGKPTIYPEMLGGGAIGLEASPTLALIDSLRESGIATVDLLRPLRRAKDSAGTPLFLLRDTHWSPLGLEIASREIASALLEIPTISGSRDTSRYTTRDTVVERWGDICEMTALAERRSIWKPESVVARRTLDEDGAPYRDSDSASILWLGDSYSRIYQTDAPGSAGIIARVAARIGQPMSSVVNDGGASTLVRRKLLQKRHLLESAKVVVWEFVERDIRSGAEGWAVEGIPFPD